jgi:hypothetical protein
MNNLGVKNLGLAFGATLAIFYVACFLMMTICGRETTIFIFNSLLHGLDITTIVRMDIPIWDSFVGLIGTFILGGVMGSFIATIYNALSNSKSQG